MNIYKGCCHGCIYCDSRSNCYHIDHFDTVRAKKDALLLIRDELRRKVKTGVIATGSMSDPYNPFEKDLKLTQHALELIEAYHFGISIATKSTLITRDIPILQGIAENAPVICKVTVTSSEDRLSQIIEPHAPCSSKRLEAIAKLTEAKIYSGILFMPMLPFITGTKENIERVVKSAKEVGAKFIYPSFGVTLRENQRDYFYEQLDKQFPGVKQKYIQSYGTRYQCGIANAKKMYELFARACMDNGILYSMQDIILDYKRKYRSKQMSIFDFLS